MKYLIIFLYLISFNIAQAGVVDNTKAFIRSVFRQPKTILNEVKNVNNTNTSTTNKELDKAPLNDNKEVNKDVDKVNTGSNPFEKLKGSNGVNISQDSKQTNNQKVSTDVKIDDIAVRFTNIDELVSTMVKAIARTVELQIEVIKERVDLFGKRLDISEAQTKDISDRQKELEKLQVKLTEKSADIEKVSESIKEVSKANASILSSVNSQSTQSGSNLSNIITDISTLKNNVSTLSTVSNNIASLQTNFANLNNQFNALVLPTISTSSVDSIITSNSTINGLQDQIIALNTALGMSTSSVASIGESITNLQNLQPQIDSLISNLQQATSTIDNLISSSTLISEIQANLEVVSSTNSNAIIELRNQIMSYNPNSGSGSGTTITKSITQTAHGFVIGDWVYLISASTYAKTDNDVPTTSDSVGVVSAVADANTFSVSTSGYITGLTGLTVASAHFLSSTAGAITATEPTGVSQTRKPVLIADTTTSGWIIDRSGTPVVGTTAVVQYGENTGITHLSTFGTTLADIAGSSFTIPSAGTWQISYYVFGAIPVISQTGIAIYTSGDVIVPNSTSDIVQFAGGVQPGGVHTNTVQIITTAATTYKLRGITSTNTFTVNNLGTPGTAISGNSKIVWTQIGASPVPMDLLGEYGENTAMVGAALVAGTYTDIGSGSFTLPTAGVWDVTYTMQGQLITVAGSSIAFRIVDSLSSLVPSSDTAFEPSATSDGGSVTKTVRITTTGSAIYRMQGKVQAGSTGSFLNQTDYRSIVTYQKISGFIPTSGQTVDYVNVKAGATQVVTASATVNTASAAIIFNTPTITGNIPVNTSTGKFTLTAGKTYRIEATTSVAAGNFVAQWVNATAGTFIGQRWDQSTSAGFNVGGPSFIITPTVTTEVFIQVVAAATTHTIGTSDGNGVRVASVTIIQIGSSAITGGTNLVGIRTLTSGTSYTPTSGVTKIKVYVIGGGAAGGGCASSINTTSAGGGSAGGVVGFTENVSSGTTYTYSIGAGGTGVSGATGNDGVQSTITVNGNIYTGGGGLGGTVATNNIAPSTTGSSLGGTTSPASVSGNAFYVSNGGSSGIGMAISSNVHATGFGGSNMFGTGGRGLASNASGSAAGSAGDGFGGGGSGARQNNTTAVSGGSGTSGAIIIEEYK